MLKKVFDTSLGVGFKQAGAVASTACQPHNEIDTAANTIMITLAPSTHALAHASPACSPTPDTTPAHGAGCPMAFPGKGAATSVAPAVFRPAAVPTTRRRWALDRSRAEWMVSADGGGSKFTATSLAIARSASHLACTTRSPRTHPPTRAHTHEAPPIVTHAHAEGLPLTWRDGSLSSRSSRGGAGLVGTLRRLRWLWCDATLLRPWEGGRRGYPTLGDRGCIAWYLRSSSRRSITLRLPRRS